MRIILLYDTFMNDNTFLYLQRVCIVIFDESIKIKQAYFSEIVSLVVVCR